MPTVDSKWAERIRAGDRRALASQFQHEVRELRRLMLEQPAGIPVSWRDFRCFLADVGPSPGPAFRVQGSASDGSCGPDTVRWVQKSAATSQGPATPPPASAASAHSQWTMIAGMSVQYAELPQRLGVSFGAISAAVAGGMDMEEVVAELGHAQGECADLSWFSESAPHQEAFRQAYMAWRLRVQPRFRGAASAKFLYLYMLVPAMAQAKLTLIQAGLWKPLTPSVLAQRDASAAWKRFNELLPKAAVTVASFDIYRQYSLTEDIEELSERLVAAEQRFRTGAAPNRAAPARAAG